MKPRHRTLVALAGDVRSAVLLAALLIYCWVPAAAQQAPDTLEVELPPVTVEATRASETQTSAPFAVTLLNRSALEVSIEPAMSLQDVLAPVPGLWVNDRGHFAMGERIVMRGSGWRSSFGVRGVMVVVDGVPLTMPDGQAFADIVDPSLIRSAEVIRGPASVFWGNASGGVLYLKTIPGGAAPFLRFRGLAGSYGERHLLGEAAFGVGRGRMSLYASHVERDGYRSHSGGRFERAGLHVRFPAGRRTVYTATAAGALQSALNPGALTSDQVASDRRQVTLPYVESQAGKESVQLQVTASADHALSLGTFSGSVFGVLRDLDNPLPFAYIDLDRLAGGARVRLVSDPYRRIRWAVGGDAARQLDERLNFENEGGEPGSPATLDQLETVTNAALYAYASTSPVSAVDFSVGVRADAIRFRMEDHLLANGDASGDRSFNAFSPTAGVSYDAGELLFFANYATSFETPTTTELVNRPDATGGFNPLLKPEYTRGVEIGARGSAQNGSIRYEAALFRSVVDNILVQQESEGGREFYRNAGTNQNSGAEANLYVRPLRALMIQLSYSWSNLRFATGALEGNEIPGVPAHRAHLRTTLTHRGVRLSASGKMVSEYYADEENLTTTPGYTLISIHAAHEGIRIGNAAIQPFAEIENIFDVTYNASVIVNAFGGRYFEPAAGRIVRVGVNVSL